MSDWMRDTVGPGGSAAAAGSGSDYRIREVEARLDRRLTVVEAQRGGVRWTNLLTGVGLAVAFAALVLVLWTATPNQGVWSVESLSAEEIVLRDADGVSRGRLSTDSEGRAQFALTDRDGRERIRLTVLGDGSPGVTMIDADARPRAVLGYLADGTTNLVLADARGVSRAVFGLDPDGSTQALFADRGGAIRTLVGVDADGEPSVSVFEDAGREGAQER